MVPKIRIYPVIIAGGSGTRFWPWSTQYIPKQFLPLIHSKKSMIQMTVERLKPLAKKKDIWIISHKRFHSLLKKQIHGSSFLLEPESRNTAAAIGWAAVSLIQKDPEAIMIVVPSDHWICDSKKNVFINNLKEAALFIEKNPSHLLTFGIKPSYPETGYGYIQAAEKANKNIYFVKKFIEKPYFPQAKKMAASSKFFWNSGIFVWKAQTILDEIKKYLPSLYNGLKKINRKDLHTIYKTLPNISIDYAVMEKSQNVDMLKASFEWSDVGSWESLSFKRKNRVKKWISLDSANCFIDVPQKIVATVGVKNLIIVDTSKGLLVCHRKDAQRVKEVSRFLK